MSTPRDRRYDGNLVLYTAAGRPVWFTATGSALLAGGQQLLAGQSLYLSSIAAGPRATAQSLIMQGDGNLVDYLGGTANWSSQTFVPGSRAVMQTDGNFVVYTPSNRPVWSSGTFGANTDADVLELVFCQAQVASLAGTSTLWSTPVNLSTHCFG